MNGAVLGMARGLARTVPPAIAVKLEAAAELLTEEGVDNARVEDVAVAAGIPRTTLYYYFAGRDDIVAFLFQTRLNVVSEAVAAEADGDGTAAERFERVVRAQIGIIAEHPGASKLLLASLGKAAHKPDLVDLVHASFHGPVERLLREGVADGSLRTSDAERDASAIVGAVLILGHHELLSCGAIDVAATAASALRLLLHGVGGTAAGGRRQPVGA